MSTTIKLSHAQVRELQRLARDRTANVGSCTNTTMKALQRHDLVDLKWDAYSTGNMSWRRERWVITNAGRALVAKWDVAQRKLRERFK